MRVVISGASGLVGRATVDLLRAAGHDTVALVRRPARADDEIEWDPAAGTLDQAALERIAPDAAVHLAGQPLDQRWTAEQKRRIVDSRTQGTDVLSRALAALPHRPAVLVCASAVGYYGDRGATELTEAASPGTGFLADTVVAWEAAADPARDADIRIVHLRFGTIQSRDGGALAKVIPTFRFFIGGPLGRRSNYISLVSLTDATRAILFALETDGLSGPANVSIPSPATQGEYAAAVGKVLHRPSLLTVPGFAMRMVAGKLVDEMVLVSQRVVPERLTRLGFQFLHPTAEDAVRAAIGSSD